MQFSTEYLETKTKEFALANHKAYRQSNEPIKPRSKHVRWREARENVCVRVIIGFGFTFDCMTMWHEFFFKPFA